MANSYNPYKTAFQLEKPMSDRACIFSLLLNCINIFRFSTRCSFIPLVLFLSFSLEQQIKAACYSRALQSRKSHFSQTYNQGKLSRTLSNSCKQVQRAKKACDGGFVFYTCVKQKLFFFWTALCSREITCSILC